MADDQEPFSNEPRGFGSHNQGLASENAHQQGWGLDQEERTQLPIGKQQTDGGTDYEYGAQDFGDEPVDESTAGITPQLVDEARKRLQK